MKNKFILLTLLSILFLIFNQFGFSQELRLPNEYVPDKTENLTTDDLRKLQKNFFQTDNSLENLFEPLITTINFDDLTVTANNTVPISPNRYSGLSFYSPYSNNYTYLTNATSYSYPNSLTVGYPVATTGGYNVYSVDSLVVDFALPAKDVSFIWIRETYNYGQIEVYENNNQLVATIPVNFGSYTWLSIPSLNQYSQRIKKLILRRPAVQLELYGHIVLDNFNSLRLQLNLQSVILTVSQFSRAPLSAGRSTRIINQRAFLSIVT